MCKDVNSVLYSFFTEKDAISLQNSSIILKSCKDEMEKYRPHIYPHGKIKKFHKNGILQLEENYKEGHKEGTQRQWYSNGCLMYEENYYRGNNSLFKGLKHGIQKSWNLDTENQIGSLDYEENYKYGKKEGIQKRWYRDSDQLFYEKNYSKGKENGIQKYWYGNGYPKYEKVFIYGCNNIQTEWDIDGNLINKSKKQKVKV